jgi:hypothetical protein
MTPQDYRDWCYVACVGLLVWALINIDSKVIDLHQRIKALEAVAAPAQGEKR